MTLQFRSVTALQRPRFGLNQIGDRRGVALLMPMWLFSLVGVEFRLPYLIICLVVASTSLETKNRPFVPALARMALLLFRGRIWSTTEIWRGYDQEFREFREAPQNIDPSARAIVARFEERPWFVLRRVDSHVVSLEVIKCSVSLPDLFTGPHQPLGATPAYTTIDMPNGDQLELKHLEMGIDPVQAGQLKDTRLSRGARPYWGNWPRNLDYVVMLDADDQDNPFPDLSRSVHVGLFFAIYAVDRDPSEQAVVYNPLGQRRQIPPSRPWSRVGQRGW